jgi:RNA polymerase sigma-70 factor, ECF subfamily
MRLPGIGRSNASQVKCHSVGGDNNNHIHDATDAFLTLAARSGSSSAFEELSRRHSKRIRCHIYRILRSWDDTEDVLQDSLLKAFTHIGTFRNESGFSTWLTRIAINSALMALRKKSVRKDTSDAGISSSNKPLELWELPDLSPNPEHICTERQLGDLLQVAIRQLPAAFRSVAELCLAQEHSVSEVAQTLGLTVPAVKARLRRAKKELRISLPIKPRHMNRKPKALAC